MENTSLICVWTLEKDNIVSSLMQFGGWGRARKREQEPHKDLSKIFTAGAPE